MAGVIAVTRIPTGVAVTAATFDQAQRARDALAHHLEPGPERRPVGCADLRPAAVVHAAASPCRPSARGPSSAASTSPSHLTAPLEVWNCVADVRSDRAELWCSSKSPIVASQRWHAIGLAGRPGDVPRRPGWRVLRSPAVLGPGHRGGPGVEGDRSTGAADVDPQRRHAPRSHAAGQPPPGPGHPPARHGAHLRAPHGDPARRLRPRLGRRAHRGGLRSRRGDGDPGGVRLSQKVPYDVGVVTQQLADAAPPSRPAAGARSTPARSAANEVMVDQVARTLGQDPVQFRRQRLSSAGPGRARSVASAGRWGRTMAAGTAQGVALWVEYKSVVAYLVEIDARDAANPGGHQGRLRGRRRHRGEPRGLEAQMQGALIDGLSMACGPGSTSTRGPSARAATATTTSRGCATRLHGSRCTTWRTATNRAARASSASRRPQPRSPTPPAGHRPHRHPIPDRRLRRRPCPPTRSRSTACVRRSTPRRLPLLWVLRDLLGVTGRWGRGSGSPRLHQPPLTAGRSSPAPRRRPRLRRSQGHDHRGLASGGRLHPVQQAWLDEDAAVRGFCQPGRSWPPPLLASTPNPTDAQIDTIARRCRAGPTYASAPPSTGRPADLHGRASKVQRCPSRSAGYVPVPCGGCPPRWRRPGPGEVGVEVVHRTPRARG